MAGESGNTHAHPSMRVCGLNSCEEGGKGGSRAGCRNEERIEKGTERAERGAREAAEDHAIAHSHRNEEQGRSAHSGE